MAKANLVLPNGTTVAIEGTADEVAALLIRFSGTGTQSAAPAATKPVRKRKGSKAAAGQKRVSRKGPQTLIEDLLSENFFKSKRTIGEIQKKLEEKGHI